VLERLAVVLPRNERVAAGFERLPPQFLRRDDEDPALVRRAQHPHVAAQLEADPSDTLKVQQLAADRWRTEFNEVRPHESLQMRTPAEVYVRSTRSYLGIRSPSYPPNHAVRRVSHRGCIRYQGKTIFISASLAGFDVAVRRRASRLAVRFYDLSLGFFDFALAPPHHPPRLVSPTELPRKTPVYSP